MTDVKKNDAATSGDDKPKAEAKASAPAKAAKAVKPSGVISVFLLEESALGPKGAVVPVSRRKLKDLGLKQGQHWADPDDKQLAISGLS
jgi:hypothetical protein